MRRILLIVSTVVVVLLVLAIALAIYISIGSYNIGTSNHDNGFVNWWLNTGATRSIKHQARGIKPPPLDNPARVQEGFKHYHEMCVQCHGAPGKEPGEIAKGLWPQAPDYSMLASGWTPAQLFWITKNGIKFSAMPGWGASHSDDKIWDIVAFVQKVGNLSPADYHQMETNTVGVKSSDDQQPAPNEAHH
ncbi:MAG TPA: cytochrome c [Verrucomicrobiae bacterium]|nr:cytochrome c [Verrucomicrobiae bacterium]